MQTLSIWCKIFSCVFFILQSSRLWCLWYSLLETDHFW